MNQTNWLDDWTLVEQGFNRQLNRDTEQQMWLGNGRFGHRANFEERFSGHTIQKNETEGAFLSSTQTDKENNEISTISPINSPNWFGIDIEIDGEPLDLNLCAVYEFKRSLYISKGYLERSCKAKMKNGKMLKIHTQRFCSIADDETAAIRYAVTPVNFSGKITFIPHIDADVMESGKKIEEKLWVEIDNTIEDDLAYIIAETKESKQTVATAMRMTVYQDTEEVEFDYEKIQREKYAAYRVTLDCEQLQETVMYKYAAVLSSANHRKHAMANACQRIVNRAFKKGFRKMFLAQHAAWAERWSKYQTYWDAIDKEDKPAKLAFFKTIQTEYHNL